MTAELDERKVNSLAVLLAALGEDGQLDVPGLLFRVSKIKYAGEDTTPLYGSPYPNVEIGQDGSVAGEDGDVMTTMLHRDGFTAVVHGVYRHVPYTSERLGPFPTRIEAETAARRVAADLQAMRAHG